MKKKMVPYMIVWIERHKDGLRQIEHLHTQKPDWGNDAVHSRPTIQKVRIWLEPLGKEKLAKVWKEI